MPSDIEATIFAKASGAGPAAVAVLRLSGPETALVLRQLAGELPPPRRASVRTLRCPLRSEILDRALLLWFPAPGSYTGQDAAELHLHGSPAVVAAVSDALVALGCRVAEPGEFTRRAFLHGKMDLLQAEGLADLIAAETAVQRRQALRQADGALSRLYEAWTARATRLLAHQEAAIEFVTDDLPTDLDRRARSDAALLCREMAEHLDDGGRGERLRQGISIAILGAPNAGKSSLLNALVGRDAAIVATRPGTTRDIVECRIDLDGVPAVIADTAGLRRTEDEVEQEGVRRARQRAHEADLVLAAFPADTTPDAETLELVRDEPGAILVATKTDLAEPPPSLGGRPLLATSSRTGAGLIKLRAALSAAASQRAALADTPALTRARHRAAVTEAAARLEEAAAASHPEIAAEGYRSAVTALGRLTGRGGVEDVLDIVFADFCIGK